MNTPNKTRLPEFVQLSPHGELLFELIKNLNVAFGFERSFKMQEKIFLPKACVVPGIYADLYISVDEF